MRPSASGLLLVLLAVPAALLALSAGLGIGMLRQGPAVLVSAVAVVAVLAPPCLPAALSPDRLAAYGGGLLGWSVVLLLSFPTYFPAERAHAFTAGLGALAQVFSVELSPQTGTFLDGVLPGADGTTPAAPALPAEPDPAPRPRPTRELVREVVSAAPSDVVVLPYEGRGSSLKVPVDLEGADGEVLEVMMLFDTGASFTSVDRATLDELGVKVPRNAPEVVVRTANGERKTQLVLVERVWLGGLAIDGVTVGICDACAHDDEVGLLGLNVSGRFLVTVDQERREIQLQPRASADRTADIRYWVEPSARATRWDDGRIEIEATLANNAERTVRDAVVRIDCEEPFTAAFPPVGPGEEELVRVGLPDGTDCAGYTIALESARW